MAILYRQGESFIYRHCAGLAYRTQREERSLRLIRRAQAIRRSLGASAELRDLADAKFPSKPRFYLHQAFRKSDASLHAIEPEGFLHGAGIRLVWSVGNPSFPSFF